MAARGWGVAFAKGEKPLRDRKVVESYDPLCSERARYIEDSTNGVFRFNFNSDIYFDNMLF